MKYFPEYKVLDDTTFIDLYRQGFDRYCRQLTEYYGCLNNQGVALLDDDTDAEQDSPLIDDLFILPSFDTSATSAENFDAEQQALQSKNNISLAKLLATNPRQFILGDPGIGKTTFLHWLATGLAHHRNNYVQQAMGPLLPVLLRVRDFRTYLSDSCDAEQFIVNLKNYLGSLGELLDLDLLKQAMSNGQVLLLVDGLDEIGKQEMQSLGRSLAALFIQFPAIKCIMTARVVGFDASLLWPIVNSDKKLQTQQSNELNEINDELNDKVGSDLRNRKSVLSQNHDFSIYHIQPLNNEQRLQFSQKWCTIYVKNSDAQTLFVEDLQAAFNDNGSLSNLSRTPVLLNMICFIQHRRGRLPNGRAELYQKIIETYLVSMDRARGIENDFIDSEDFDYTDIRNWLAKMAYAMQLGKLNELLDNPNASPIESLCFESEVSRSTSLTETELLQFFTHELEEVYEDKKKCQVTAEKLIDYIKRRTGFLIDRGQDAEQGNETVFAFSHLSFQEYFAAHFISQQWSQLCKHNELVRSLTISCDAQSWFECWQLVFEDYSQNGNNRRQHELFINELFGLLDELAKKLNYKLFLWEKEDYAIQLLSRIILNPAIKLPPVYRQQQLTNLWLYSFNLTGEDESGLMLILWPELCRDFKTNDSLSRKALANALNMIGRETQFHLDLSGVKPLDLRPLKLWPDLISLNLENTQVDNLEVLSDYKNLQRLNCSNTLISDLTPIENLTRLESLSINRTIISDLTSLSKLKYLKRLSLNNTEVSDLSCLSGLTKLRMLDISSTGVETLSELKNLRGLVSLYLMNTNVDDLTPISKNLKMIHLRLDRTKVTDLTPIANFSLIERLFIGFTGVDNIKQLKNMKNLASLSLIHTEVTDLRPLSKLANLRMLQISNTKISDLTPLAKLPNLHHVSALECEKLDLNSIKCLPKKIHVHLSEPSTLIQSPVVDA
ncbi:leucine-rich repeat domain-containing protein [Shewanella frigidimarina]|uniref:leucine-rich repeat domain-containing protein n=1 Tax=Shewanella frigidimarina TaxID=56812 RepID=UPI003D7A3C1F